jgi:hypothetical protein
MVITVLLTLWLALQPAPDPHFSAQWDSATAATVQWTATGRSCLYKNQTFLGCYERTGTITLPIGHNGPIDGAFRPAAGDVFVLTIGDQTYRAPLRGRPQYLPVIGW